MLDAGIAPPPFTFDLQLDPRRTFDASSGAATVQGLATCSLPAFVTVQGSLRQRRPGLVLDAFFFSSFYCEGATPWSVAASYTPRLFRGRSAALLVGGKADASAFANAFSPSEGEFLNASVAGSLLLTGSNK